MELVLRQAGLGLSLGSVNSPEYTLQVSLHVGYSSPITMSGATYPAPSSDATEHDELTGTGKSWSLCSRCRELNLSASNFFVPGGKEDQNPENIHNPTTLDIRSWDLIKNATECSLCQLIFSAVRVASEDWQAGETPWQCELISRRLRGYNPQDEEDVRVLEFNAQCNWTSVRDCLVPVQSDDYPGAFPGRVIKPGQIDIEQVRRWLQQCETEHTGACQHSKIAEFNKLRANLLVIDVQAQCLRNLPESCRYIALSYVWGGVEQAETTTRNLQDLFNPGALGQISDAIPQAIRDAMELVKQLGEKYLWVDALCIVQDDQSTKQSLIDHMHIIYANAYVTLFAASGNNSNAGLPGVLPSSRKVDQLMAPVAHGLTFIYPSSFATIKKSAWATRGWTYQEYFFSLRRLIFIAGQVIYQCNTIRWQEDLAQEHIPRHLTSFQVDRGGRGLGWEPPNVRFPNYPKNRWCRYHYATYLTTYLDRNLSQDSDILNAFAGVINDAADGGLTTLYGLTKEYFGLDMLWKHSTWATRRPGFPSWSWAGWKGSIVEPGHGELSSEEIWLQRKSWIHWYLYDEKRGSFSLLASGHRPEVEEEITKEEIKWVKSVNEIGKMRQESTSSALSDATISNIRCDNTLVPLLARLSLTCADEAPTTRPIPFPAYCIPSLDHSTLMFRTLTAYLSVSALKPDGQKAYAPRRDSIMLPSTSNLYLYTKRGIHIGTAWVSTEDMYNDVLRNDEQGNDRLTVEIAVLSGPGTGDWRTRNENPSTWQYMQELASAGMNLGDLKSRYQTRMEYERLIGGIYIRMVKDQGDGASDDTSTKVPPGFWERLATQASLEIARSGKFPGHTAADLQCIVDSLKLGGKGMSEKDSVGFLQILLIGHLGDGQNNGSGGLKERIGIGEVREETLALINGLALRDVLLR
ncbi:heterokaryon incompatibility protein-domain-containing protein [Thelonectria olida]|uniref:Heterokaryon incompatibility protein-domain-containing protein n=1 Tax=Thelonectria olida TaxID=1576542 RepID=A0A9P8VLZ5_9HYPO|nr:heterokaryon incompatibility protein-domain-containing protein [Thelonectria olida]